MTKKTNFDEFMRGEAESFEIISTAHGLGSFHDHVQEKAREFGQRFGMHSTDAMREPITLNDIHDMHDECLGYPKVCPAWRERFEFMGKLGDDVLVVVAKKTGIIPIGDGIRRVDARDLELDFDGVVLLAPSRCEVEAALGVPKRTGLLGFDFPIESAPGREYPSEFLATFPAIPRRGGLVNCRSKLATTGERAPESILPLDRKSGKVAIDLGPIKIDSKKIVDTFKRAGDEMREAIGRAIGVEPNVQAIPKCEAVVEGVRYPKIAPVKPERDPGFDAHALGTLVPDEVPGSTVVNITRSTREFGGPIMSTRERVSADGRVRFFEREVTEPGDDPFSFKRIGWCVERIESYPAW